MEGRVESRVLEGLGPCYHMQVLTLLTLLSLLSSPLLTILASPPLALLALLSSPQYCDGDRRIPRASTEGCRRVPRRRVLLDQCDVQVNGLYGLYDIL